ncbi:MAG: hypothetical protein KGH94_02320 [Candidatus Micrarchaeota archaeon]|nr:hypothetical protein [Candidatus Micrarchaeota archaeon]
MDHNSGSNYQSTVTQTNANFDPYVTENGNKFRVPYRIIKKVVFSGVSKADMIDIPHAARLQYRLMLLEPIIKASVDFTKSKITVIYNPDTSDNNHPKISIDDLREVLKKEGINTDTNHMAIEDYDYYKNFYSYAYNPPTIRERAPYGYTQEQWQRMKPEWEAKIQRGEIEKQEKFKAFQDAYLEENPDIAHKIDPNYKPGEKKLTLKEKLLGRKKGSGGKGFWFHGI